MDPRGFAVNARSCLVKGPRLVLLVLIMLQQRDREVEIFMSSIWLNIKV